MCPLELEMQCKLVLCFMQLVSAFNITIFYICLLGGCMRETLHMYTHMASTALALCLLPAPSLAAS